MLSLGAAFKGWLVTSKGLRPLPRRRGGALARGCGGKASGALPLPRAAAVSTGITVRAQGVVDIVQPPHHGRLDLVRVRVRVGVGVRVRARARARVRARGRARARVRVRVWARVGVRVGLRAQAPRRLQHRPRRACHG